MAIPKEDIMPKLDARDFIDCSKIKWESLSIDEQTKILYDLFDCSKKEALVIIEKGYDV